MSAYDRVTARYAAYGLEVSPGPDAGTYAATCPWHRRRAVELVYDPADDKVTVGSCKSGCTPDEPIRLLSLGDDARAPDWYQAATKRAREARYGAVAGNGAPGAPDGPDPYLRMLAALEAGGYAGRRSDLTGLAGCSRHTCPLCGAPGDGHGLRVSRGDLQPVVVTCDHCKLADGGFLGLLARLGLVPDDIMRPRPMRPTVDFVPDAADRAGQQPTAAAPDELTADGYAALLARAVLGERIRRDARRAVDAEEHARDWAAPEDLGSLAEELEIPDSGPAWRLDGLLGAGHNAIIVASRKAGKTTAINNLIKSYVDGGPFLGRFPVTPTDAAVGVFNYEVDARQYRHWLRDARIRNAHRVFVLHLRGRSLPVKNPRVRAWVADWLRRRGVGLWIVDPYSRAYVGSVDDGNGEAQVGAFLDTLDVIKTEAGVGELVMAVHTPKARAEAGEETAIGSQRLEAWPDSMWYLTRDLVTGSRFLRAEGRDVGVPEQQLSYNPTDRSLTLGGGSRAEVRRSTEERAFLDYLVKKPGATTNDIAKALECGTTKVGQIKAATQGLWRAEDGPRKSVLHYLADASVDHTATTALTGPEQLSTTTALLPIGSSSGAVVESGDLRSSDEGPADPGTAPCHCGRASHAGTDWGPCTRCDTKTHRYGPGGRALCDTCHQGSGAA